MAEPENINIAMLVQRVDSLDSDVKTLDSDVKTLRREFEEYRKKSEKADDSMSWAMTSLTGKLDKHVSVENEQYSEQRRMAEEHDQKISDTQKAIADLAAELKDGRVEGTDGGIPDDEVWRQGSGAAGGACALGDTAGGRPADRIQRTAGKDGCRPADATTCNDQCRRPCRCPMRHFLLGALLILVSPTPFAEDAPPGVHAGAWAGAAAAARASAGASVKTSQTAAQQAALVSTQTVTVSAPRHGVGSGGSGVFGRGECRGEDDHGTDGPRPLRADNERDGAVPDFGVRRGDGDRRRGVRRGQRRG